MDLVRHNRDAWTRETERDNIWTIPVSPEAIDMARKGALSLLLTPTKPVPREWYPALESARVLCLASGGGQQGPILSAAGADVTVFDNCPAQLERDRMVAERDGLSLKTEQGDMRDLSRYPDDSFDMIFHPVSNVFVDDVKVVWRQCHRVLKKGGTLLAGFMNPLAYIFDYEEWEVRGARRIRYKIPYSDLEQLDRAQLEKRIREKETLEFGHRLQDQIGGQIEAGFAITGFYEDKANDGFLDDYIDVCIATKAEKL